MKSVIKRIYRWFFPCKHLCCMDDLQQHKVADCVSCPCLRCGELLIGPYGLALPCEWGGRHKL